MWNRVPKGNPWDLAQDAEWLTLGGCGPARAQRVTCTARWSMPRPTSAAGRDGGLIRREGRRVRRPRRGY